MRRSKAFASAAVIVPIGVIGLTLTGLPLSAIGGHPLTRSAAPSAPALSHGDAPAQATPAPTAPTATTPPGWRRVDTGEFSLALPPGWRYNPLRGIDSMIGEFVGDGVELHFDFGNYSNRLADPGDPGYDVSFETIGGRSAKLVVARESPADLTGVYFAQVRVSPSCEFTRTVKLNVYGRLTPDQQPIALSIFRSINFDRPEAWEVIDAPGDAALADVEMLSANEGWAVGAEGTILHYAGGAWAAVQSPTEASLTAIDMLSPSEGWAVGERTILSFESGAWSVVDIAVPAPLADISMVDPENGWIVGPDIALRFRDGRWRVIDGAPGGVAVSRVYAADVDGEEAVSVDGHRLTRYTADDRWEALPWEGRPDAQGLALDFWFSDEGWIAGRDGNGGALVLHYCSGAVEEAVVEASGPVLDIEANVWAVGGAPDRPAVILQYDGHHWRKWESPFRGTIRAVSSIDLDEAWAVGARTVDGREEGVLLHFTAPQPAPPRGSFVVNLPVAWNRE